MLRKVILPALLIIPLILVGWAFWFEPASLRVAYYEDSFEQWSIECNDLSIAILADLHVGSPYNGMDRLQEIVSITNKAGPDLVLLAGDYVIQGVLGGTFVAPEAAALELAKLDAPLGTFAVLGNHDWWLDAARVETALNANGIVVLEDANTLIATSQCQFTLAGISDFWEGPHDITRALSGRNPTLPVVAFSHNPDIIPQLPPAVTYFIAGHTHGGQVNFPIVGRLIVPSEFGERYAAGIIRDGSHRAFVSTGIGTSIIPARFRVPPEVTMLRLRSSRN